MADCESNGCIVADFYENVVRVRSTQTGTVMQATSGEWVQFIEEVKAGRWDSLTATAFLESA
jgi:hypothetical protein